MVEGALVKEHLTDAMIEAGAALTEELERLGLSVSTAFWFYVPELNEWRLLFATSEATNEGPLSVYGKIRSALGRLGTMAREVPLSVVRVLEPEEELVRVLNEALSTGPGIHRIRFSKNVLDGHFIDDALVYRAA